MDSKATATLRSPDVSACRAEYCGMGDLFYCLSDLRLQCDYPLSFGGKHFCRHPQNVEIADHSTAQQEAADSST